MQMVQRAVPFVETEGAYWIKMRDCLSCHHTSFMAWSLNSAKSLAVEVDSKQMIEWYTWATNWQHHVAGKNRAQAGHPTSWTVIALCVFPAQANAG